MRVEKINLTKLHFESNRAYGGEGDIKILAEDIKTNGLINQLTVKPSVEYGEGHFDIVAGRRRKLALEMNGAKTAPCNILEGKEIEHAEEIAGSENINRMAMHPLDEAVIFQKILENGEAIENLAKRYDRKISEIYQRISLLELEDGIKEMYRAGKIELLSAAMLRNLTPEEQQAFYNKHCNSKSVNRWDVIGFISKARNSNLFQFIVSEECVNCKTRTYFNDKKLFPELNDEKDMCLNHDCYMQKWQKRLLAEFLPIQETSKDHLEAKLIVTNCEDLKNIFGKKFDIDGTEYNVIHVKAWSFGAEVVKTKSKNAQPCFYVSYDSTPVEDEDGKYTGEALETLEILPRYYKKPDEKEKDESKTQKVKNPFVNIVKFADVPEAEQKPIVDAMLSKCNLKELYLYDSPVNRASDLNRTVKKNVLNRLYDLIAKKTPSIESQNKFIEKAVEDRCDCDREVIKKLVGTNKVADLLKMPTAKLFTALYVSTISAWNLPNMDDLQTVKHNELAECAGITIAQLKEMYKEETRKLLPKPVMPKGLPADTKAIGVARIAKEKEIKDWVNGKGKKLEAGKKPKKVGSGKRGMIKT